MTKEEIQNGNKLIAEFMGFTIYSNSAVFKPASCSHILEKHIRDYDKFWDWLMPVVEKIDHISSLNGHAHHYWNINAGSDIRIFREPIDITWEESVKFINWYNTQTK